MIELRLEKNHSDCRVLVVEDRPYVDTVYSVDPICMFGGDMLTISYDLTIYSYTDDRLTGKKLERFAYTLKCRGKRMTVRFIRFTKLHDIAQIRVYARMPKDIVCPNPKLAAARTG